MTAAEPTPLEAAGFAWWSVHMHVGTWVDGSPEMRAYYAEQAAKIVAPALAGDWLERVLAETSPCVWSIPEEGHPYGAACLDEHPDRHPGVGFCWVRPKKQAAAIRAAAGVGL